MSLAGGTVDEPEWYLITVDLLPCTPAQYNGGARPTPLGSIAQYVPGINAWPFWVVDDQFGDFKSIEVFTK